jgi:hypothetical protein
MDVRRAIRSAHLTFPGRDRAELANAARREAIREKDVEAARLEQLGHCAVACEKRPVARKEAAAAVQGNDRRTPALRRSGQPPARNGAE